MGGFKNKKVRGRHSAEISSVLSVHEEFQNEAEPLCLSGQAPKFEVFRGALQIEPHPNNGIAVG